MASTAMVIMGFCPQAKREKLEILKTPLVEPLCPCNDRNAGKPGAAASFRGSSDISPARASTKSRAPAWCWCVFSNAVVLG
jgi:hypothetical protein